jgi:predicted PurR-regulated permease PerM
MNVLVRKPVAISYLIIFAALILVAALRLSTPFITVLFAYFILSRLRLGRKRWIAVCVFVILVAAIFCAFVFFLRSALVALPDIVSDTVPKVVAFANRHGIDLPFDDAQSLKDVAMASVKETLGYLGNFAKIATKEFVFLLLGVVIAIGIFLNPEPGRERRAQSPEGADLYTFYFDLIAERFRAFYRSFEQVMGAQLLISAINTALTAAFVFGFSLRYAGVVVGLTFVCGLLPIVGNIVSNMVIVGIAFTKSPEMAGWALAFLVAVHKLEYFLNSKIIGSRIRHPMWLMLLALILGERLMGIPGIILAPVVLNFVKTEASQYRVVNGSATAPPVIVESKG